MRERARAWRREPFQADPPRAAVFFFPHVSFLLHPSPSPPPPPQIRKLPALHQPYLHVLWAAGGAVAANALVDWTDRASAEVEADVARRAALVRASGRG